MMNTEAEQETPIVYIVDDDDAVRYALTGLFDSVGLKNQSYTSGDEFIETFTGGQAGCLVVDIRMPGMSGLEVQRSLKDKGIIIPVIVITGHGDIETGIQAMKNGAFDFIQKPVSDEALLDIVQAAIQQHMEQRTSGHERDRIALMLGSLSKREHEVLDKIIDGEPNKRIAKELNLSEKTIEFHRANIMKKMAARSLADLIRKTLQVKPVDAPGVTAPAQVN